jgi:hypothetical protein
MPRSNSRRAKSAKVIPKRNRSAIAVSSLTKSANAIVISLQGPAERAQKAILSVASFHVAAAAVLATLVAGVYGRIAWGMFIGSDDFYSHIALAGQFYNTGRPPVPHFLFHGLVAALYASQLASSLVAAGRFWMVVCYVAIPLIMYGILRIEFKNSFAGGPLVLFAVALATLVAQPITLAQAYALGYFWPEPYQIPTSTLLKPFALAGFWLTFWYLTHRRIHPLLTALFALTTVAGALSKPSFMICILPAATIFGLYRLYRRLPISTSGLLLGLYLPGAAVLAWQFYSTYLGPKVGGAYHDAIDWAPLKFMSYWATGLLAKFLLSIAFPLAVALLYWKEARRDALLQLSWLTFLFGTFYSYMIAERVYWGAGNFVWSGYITDFLLIVGSAVFWLRQVSLKPSSGWLRCAAILCGAVLLLHTVSGVRMDWLYLTHYGCPLNFRDAKFACSP